MLNKEISTQWTLSVGTCYVGHAYVTQLQMVRITMVTHGIPLLQGN